MRNMLILIFIFLILIGCTVKSYKPGTEIAMVNNVRLYSNNKIMSVVAPKNLEIPYKGFSTNNKDFLSLSRFVQDRVVEKVLLNNYYISKEYDLFNSSKYLSQDNWNIFEKNISINKKTKYYNEEYGIKYDKVFINYIDGVRCRTFPRKESYQKDYEHNLTINTKEFDTYCSYYNFSGDGKLLWVNYLYNYSFESEFFKGIKKPELRIEILKDIEIEFKQNMKEIFDSIQLHDMDRERMQKEGLLYNKTKG